MERKFFLLDQNYGDYKSGIFKNNSTAERKGGRKLVP